MSTSEYHKQYHQKRKNDPEYRERRKKVIKNIIVRNRKWVDQYKIDHGCAICGYNKCARALSFHHIDPNTKKCTISTLCNCRASSVERIQTEINKCIILCANCHMELHDK
jgi:hypothetical protein